MIRTVNQDVAVQTGTSAHLGTRGGRSRLLGAVDGGKVAGRQIGAAVDLSAVVAAMTLLAQVRRARLQQRRDGIAERT